MVLDMHDPDDPYNPFRNVFSGGGTPAPPGAGGTTTPLVTPTNGVGGGGGGYSGGLRPSFHFENAPDFIAPQWNAPTMQDALNEPGYQFRLQGGSDALERSAAAKGLLRTGGTLKDITEYGQNFATQEYGNVFNRALQGYDRDYRGAYDEYKSDYDPWALRSTAEIQAGLAAFSAAQNKGGGGGGGSGFRLEDQPIPAPMTPPPGLVKDNNPDYLAWLEWKRTHPNG